MRVLIAKHLPDQNNVPVDDVDPQIINMIKTSGTLVVAGEVLEANQSGMANQFPRSTKKYPYTQSIGNWNHLASSNITLTLNGAFVDYALSDPVVTKLKATVNMAFAQKFETEKTSVIPSRPYLVGIVRDPEGMDYKVNTLEQKSSDNENDILKWQSEKTKNATRHEFGVAEISTPPINESSGLSPQMDSCGPELCSKKNIEKKDLVGECFESCISVDEDIPCSVTLKFCPIAMQGKTISITLKVVHENSV